MLLWKEKSWNCIMMQQHVKIVAKDSQKISLKIKALEKLELIAILQVNTEMQHIVYVI